MVPWSSFFSWLFLVIIGGFWWFLTVCCGSWLFVVVLGSFSFLGIGFAVLDGS